MGCPPEISEIVLKILDMGLLRIRALAWSGQANRCAIEADHIHNLPELLADFSHDRLSYYWNIERPSYIAQASEEQISEWETIWKRLQPHVDHMNASTAIR